MLITDRIVWDKLASVLDAHPGESLHVPASPPWNSRDVYAHFDRWLNRSNAHIQAFCAGKKLPELPAAPEKDERYLAAGGQRPDARGGTR